MTRPEPGRKAIFGPEPWREIEGVTFVYWDRWLLRLALDEADGLEGLAARRAVWQALPEGATLSEWRPR